MIMNFIYQNELRDSQISVCRGVLILPYKNGYLSTVCCDIAFCKSLAESGIRNYDEASIGWINFIKMRNEIKDIHWNE